MKLQVLCVCALLGAVACRSLDEGRQGQIPTGQLDDGDVTSRVKRCIVGCNIKCSTGKVNVGGFCVSCDEYKKYDLAESVKDETCRQH